MNMLPSFNKKASKEDKIIYIEQTNISFPSHEILLLTIFMYHPHNAHST